MKRQTIALAVVGVAALALTPLWGCSRSAAPTDSPSTPRLVEAEGARDSAVPSTGEPLSKRELVAAALAAMQGQDDDGPYCSACVSLNELLAVCPDIANAVGHEQDPSQCWSWRPMMSLPRQAPLMTPADQPASSDPEAVELQDITVHFSVDGRVYQIVLDSPCLYGGEVYGGVDVPTVLGPS